MATSSLSCSSPISSHLFFFLLFKIFLPCKGFACPNIDGSGISPCVDGFFSAAGDARCHFCPAGFECPSPGRNMKIPCKPGSYSGGGRTFCSLCNPGFFCPRRDAVRCHDYSYNCSSSVTRHRLPTFDSSCYTFSFMLSICIYAFVSSFHSQLLELSCTAGTFSIGNQTECTPCPAGHFCPTFSGFSAQVCPDGTYSLGRQQSCTRCPAGRCCLCILQLSLLFLKLKRWRIVHTILSCDILIWICRNVSLGLCFSQFC